MIVILPLYDQNVSDDVPTTMFFAVTSMSLPAHTAPPWCVVPSARLPLKTTRSAAAPPTVTLAIAAYSAPPLALPGVASSFVASLLRMATTRPSTTIPSLAYTAPPQASERLRARLFVSAISSAEISTLPPPE